MKRLIAIVFLSFPFLLKAQQLTGYVNPFIGTDAHGHTYPGATVPFGAVQLSPDNGTQGWDWCSGYHYSDSVIQGFSHTHLSGTGIGDLCDISVLPIVNKQPSPEKMISRFSHADEKASPGYYSVLLKDYNIKAEFTASMFTGFHRYTFPKATDAMIRFDLGFAINWDAPTACSFKRINDSTFAGYRFSNGWAKDQRVWFAVRLSKPVKSVAVFEGKNRVAKDEYSHKNLMACLMFDTEAGETIEMKVSLSYANAAGAMSALEQSAPVSFDAAYAQARQLWEKELSKVTVKSADKNLLQTFYTALYHTCLAPVNFSDINGNYKTVKGNEQHSDRPIYSINSLWDVFRAENPLFTLTQADRVADIVNSYYAFYEQYGLLPVWDLHFNETNTMTGYHSIPIIADAILKNIPGIDAAKLYDTMEKSAMQQIRGTDVYRQYGYVPQDKYGSSVTVTLEYAFDDWCIAQVAKKLGKTDAYNTFMQRAASWKNLFDTTIGFTRAKYADGKWVEPFDPYFSEHDPDKAMFTEGNSWQHSWFMPHDVYGLIDAHGGETRFVQKLDSLFTVSSQLTGSNVSNDISGLVGQYAHGNEPSHHIAYLYNYAGLPSKSAERASYIARHMYTTKPDGLCGNEDCGQMSAWYVFTAMGFYPVNAAGGEYVIGSPLLQQTTLRPAKGKTFTITAKGLSATNIYVQSATLNGKPYTKSFIRHSDIVKGGALVLVMGAKPSQTWGVKPADRPGK